MKDWFFKLTEQVLETAKPEETLALNYFGEFSDFVRFNASRVRQASSVNQHEINLLLHAHQRSLSVQFDLTGQLDQDVKTVQEQLKQAREHLQSLPETPLLPPPSGKDKSEISFAKELPTAAAMVQDISELAGELDLAGILARGPVFRGYANSLGARHWYQTDNFCFDFSLYNGPQAVKWNLAGQNWSATELQNLLNQGRKQLEVMGRPKVKIAKGEYRTYLAESAVHDLASMLNWGGVSAESIQRKNSALLPLFEGRKRFSEKFHVTEDNELGLSESFDQTGKVLRTKIPVIQDGLLKEALISEKSAAEFQLKANGAHDSETLRSFFVAPGKLASTNIETELGTGLYINNLHYLNWSDQQSARVTGMTRFACFWYSDGVCVGPIDDMRFDASLFETFGSGLCDFTQETKTFVNESTYERRQLGGGVCPGALIDGFRFTL